MIRHHLCHNVNHATQIRLGHFHLMYHGSNANLQYITFQRSFAFPADTYSSSFPATGLACSNPGGLSTFTFHSRTFFIDFYTIIYTGSTIIVVDYLPTFEPGSFHFCRTAVIPTILYTSHLILASGTPGFST